MAIKLIENKDVWDKFVDESCYGLLFHKWDFLKIMEKHTNYKLLQYGIYNGDTLICIFPLFFKKYNGLKTIFSPPPRTGVPNLGFVMSQEFDILKQNKKETYLNIVVREFNEEMKKISPNYVSISLVPNFLDVRSFKWINYCEEAHFTYVIDLSISLDEIWNSLKKELRKQIKQADELNLKLLKSDDVSVFYELEKKRYEGQGLRFPIINKNYLEDLLKAYPEYLGLFYLYDSDDEVIGIQICCEYKDRFMFWMGGVKPQKKIHSNEYLTWEFIKKAKNAGYRKLEITGAGVKNICEFKSKFNPGLEIDFRLYKKDNFGKFAEWVYLNILKTRGY
jgi:hypothetical protein